VYNFYLEARSIIAGSDFLYPLMINVIALARPRQKELLAKTGSEIVIDGFPRSANTFFETYFELAQQRPLNLAHHLHESYQIRYAERHGIPAIVLIRDPLDAVISAILRDPRAHPASLLRNYVRFYSNVLRHHGKAVLAPFDTVVTAAEQIIDQVNLTYNTDFKALREDDLHLVQHRVTEKDMLAFDTDVLDSRRVATPSAEKKAAASKMRQRIESENKVLLQRARGVYNQGLMRVAGVRSISK
jgi:hypothetical protein